MELSLFHNRAEFLMIILVQGHLNNVCKKDNVCFTATDAFWHSKVNKTMSYPKSAFQRRSQRWAKGCAQGHAGRWRGWREVGCRNPPCLHEQQKILISQGLRLTKKVFLRVNYTILCCHWGFASRCSPTTIQWVYFCLFVSRACVCSCFVYSPVFIMAYDVVRRVVDD